MKYVTCMHSSLSNGWPVDRAPGIAGLLAAGASQAAEAKDSPVSLDFTAFEGVLALGVIALVVWVGRRVSNPAKLRLVKTPGRLNHLSPLHIVGLLLVWLVAGAAAALLPEPWRYAGQIGAQAVWVLAGILVAAKAFRRGVRRGLGLTLRRWKIDTARGVIAWLAILPLCVGLLALTASIMIWLGFGEQIRSHEFLQRLPALPPAWQVVTVFTAVVMAPLAEEIFFRGLCQSMLRRCLSSPWLGIVLSSVFFTGVHYNPEHGQGPQALPALFALSIALGYNYERTGRLLAPIIAHAVFNGAFIWRQYIVAT